MNKRVLWSRILCVAGVAVIALGVAVYGSGGGLGREDMYPLCLLSASGLAALGAFLGKTRRSVFVYGALGLAAISMAAWSGHWLWLGARAYGRQLIAGDPVVQIYGLGLSASLSGAMFALLESLRPSMPAPGGVPTGRQRWSRAVSLVGLAMIAVGIVAFLFWVWQSLPSAYCVLILPGSALTALGASLGRSRYGRFLSGALGLTAWYLVMGIPTLFFPTIYTEGFPRWLGTVQCTYLFGGIMSLVGAMLVIVESFHRPPVADDTVET